MGRFESFSSGVPCVCAPQFGKPSFQGFAQLRQQCEAVAALQKRTEESECRRAFHAASSLHQIVGIGVVLFELVGQFTKQDSFKRSSNSSSDRLG